MIKLKHILNESIITPNYIVQMYKVLKQKSNKPLSGGNCGQSAYAIHRWIRDNNGVNTEIGVLTNAENEDELVNEEPDVYHMVVVFNGKPIDENGILSNQQLLDLAEDQYGNPDPEYYTFDMPSEEKKVLRIISANTNYNVDWNYFYNVLEKNPL